jgi:hypothetical protein
MQQQQQQQLLKTTLNNHLLALSIKPQMPLNSNNSL